MLDRRGWDEQFAVFAREYHAARYDVRSLGASSLPQAAFSHSDDLAALLDALVIDAAVLVGHSFAGD